MTPPPGVFAAPGSGGDNRRPDRRPIIIGVIIALVGLIIAAVLVAAGSGDKASAEVLREPVASDGPFPWTGSIAAPDAPTSVPLPTTAPQASTTTAKATRAVVAVRGDRAGIYGGTLDNSVCDKNKLIDFLEKNPAQGAAWAAVEGIRQQDIRAYISSLTPVILAVDTRVTNHGFQNGRATAHQSVLQAGSAILIDSRGVPRARCFCGNPLLPPALTRSVPTYTGQAWAGFDPGRIVVVQPAPAPINNITVINTATGNALTLALGAPPSIPTTTTTELVIPETVPTVTTLPSVTIGGQSTTTAPRQTTTTGGGASTLPTTTSTAQPTTTTTAAPSIQWKLKEIRFRDEGNGVVHTEPKQPSATGGSSIVTVRGGGGLCDGETEQMQFTWTFTKDITTLNNGDPVSISMQGTTPVKGPTCKGGLGSKSFMHMIAHVETGAFSGTAEQNLIDGDRFVGGKNVLVGSEGGGSPTTGSDTINLATTASDPKKPEAFFGLSFEGFGYEYRFLYIYAQV